jgi:hypothetical protein
MRCAAKTLTSLKVEEVFPEEHPIISRKPVCLLLYRPGGTGHDANDGHHSVIFMLGDMAVVDEVPDIESAEIHPNGDAREGVPRISVPKRNLNHVHKLPSDRVVWPAAVNPEIILGQEQKMRLVHVKFVVLQSSVLDRPVLYRPLGRDNGGWICRAEKSRSCPLDRDVKL